MTNKTHLLLEIESWWSQLVTYYLEKLEETENLGVFIRDAQIQQKTTQTQAYASGKSAEATVAHKLFMLY